MWLKHAGKKHKLSWAPVDVGVHENVCLLLMQRAGWRTALRELKSSTEFSWTLQKLVRIQYWRLSPVTTCGKTSEKEGKSFVPLQMHSFHTSAVAPSASIVR